MPSDRVKVLYINASLKDGLEGVTGKRNPSVANSSAFVIVHPCPITLWPWMTLTGDPRFPSFGIT